MLELDVLRCQRESQVLSSSSHRDIVYGRTGSHGSNLALTSTDFQSLVAAPHWYVLDPAFLKGLIGKSEQPLRAKPWGSSRPSHWKSLAPGAQPERSAMQRILASQGGPTTARQRTHSASRRRKRRRMSADIQEVTWDIAAHAIMTYMHCIHLPGFALLALHRGHDAFAATSPQHDLSQVHMMH